MKKRILSIFTILFLSLTLVFQSSIKTISAADNKSNKKTVLSIDAGRKYFSEDQLKEIIQGAYENGYSSVQLLLGNDGLRFVLDDMSIEVNDKVYNSDDVKKGIAIGNNEYYEDPNGNYLLEEEMDRILEFAGERNIDIIPVINSPGHMDAILVTMEELGMEGVRYENNGKISERTVNIQNQDAIQFVHNLIEKYVAYFAKSNVSEIFNFGADEYANDVFSSPGWGELQKNGLYDKFIDYANDLSAIIKKHGLIPMSFNDGIYYNSNDDFGTFDQDIIISYWTSGWWGFHVAAPQYFIDKGHSILNTNDGWYWVLGNIQDGPYNLDNAKKHAENKPFNELPGGTVVETIGSMQAIWADTPSKDHGIDSIIELMNIFSKKNDQHMNKPADYTSVYEVLNSIPEDLSIYTTNSVLGLNEVKESINYYLRQTDQGKVDNLAAKLNKAIEELELKRANYEILNGLIEKTTKLIPEEYTNFKEVEKVLEGIEYDLTILEQDQVDAVTEKLKVSLSQLNLKPADYTQLNDFVNQVNKLKKESYSNFESVENIIKNINYSYNIREQSEVDLITTNLKEAIEKLKLKENSNHQLENPSETIKDNVDKLPQTGIGINYILPIVSFNLIIFGWYFRKKAKRLLS